MNYYFWSFDYCIGDFFNIELPIIYSIYNNTKLPIFYKSDKLNEKIREYIDSNLTFVKILNKVEKKSQILVWKKNYKKNYNLLSEYNVILFERFKNTKLIEFKIWNTPPLIQFFDKKYTGPLPPPTQLPPPETNLKKNIGISLCFRRFLGLEKYHQLITETVKFIYNNYNVNIYFFGLPEELSKIIEKCIQDYNIKFIGKMSLDNLFKEISKMDIIISTSTSLVHMAGLLNKKIIILFDENNKFMNNCIYKLRYNNYSNIIYTSNYKNISKHPKYFMKWSPYCDNIIFIKKDYIKNIENNLKLLMT